MLRILIVSFAFLSLPFNLKSQSLVSENSVVSFSISNMGFNTVKGTFKGMTGDITFNPNNTNASNFDVCIDASTVNTGNSKRDDHLKKEDFFEVATYPTICFKASEILKTSSGYQTTGILSMHGISKTVEIPFTYSNNQLVGEFEVNRLDYNVGVGTGGFMVGKEISIKILATLKDQE